MMSSFLPQSIRNLIDEFARLPGVGPKSAQRLVMYLLHSPDSKVQGLSDAVSGLKAGLQFCSTCWNIAEDSLCLICSAAEAGLRGARQICVVEEILDVVALEKTSEFKGVYHVLHGALSPVDGIGPDQLKIQALVDRVRVGCGKEKLVLADKEASTGGFAGDDIPVPGEEDSDEIALKSEDEMEVILATNPGLEGESTALYMMKLLKPFDVNVTRIARGLPVGGDLDYADELTLTRALQGRAVYR